MTPARHSKLQEIFEAALELKGTDRAAYLDKVCTGDPNLRRHVDQLLLADEEVLMVPEPVSAPVRSAVMECPKCWQCFENPLSACPRDGTKLQVAFAGPQLIDGKYLVERRLGRGGMGAVYLARDTRLRRQVAIKVQQERFTARFEREARAIAAMNHPHICALYDIGPDYLVMEYVEGEPLRGPLPVQAALKLALQIADALDAAHRRSIIHRDLKPANILVTGDGQVKLVDFGVARLVDDRDAQQTVEGTVVGTWGYMSPEQALGKPADARSDIFSFGATLYEVLCGYPAFGGNSQAEALSAILRDKAKPLPDVASELQAVVMRCLRKNPAQRFQTMAQVKDALLATTTVAVRLPVERTPSIAVLPFANMSRDADDEYFSDGLAEEIINALTQVPGLKVIARTSAFVFRGKEQDIRKIAKTLGVNHVLEGSVRRSGNRLRITAQLIHATDGTHLWSQRYDRDMTDIFAIQDEISQAITAALKLRLVRRAQTVNIEAYQHYLKAHYYRVRLRPDTLAKAKGFFEQALAIEPNYAPAYSGLAGYYWVLGAFGLKPVGEMAPLAKSAAEKALAIDPSDCEAHSVMAIMSAIFDYDWKSAEKHYRKAMASEPILPLVRFRYAMHYLLPLGRTSDAMEQIRLGLETDPLSTVVHFGMAWAMYHDKQYIATIEYARRALENDANYHLIWFTMGLAQLGAGQTEQGIASLERVVELAPWWYMGIGSLAAAYYQVGDRERSQEWAAKLQEPQGRTFGAALYHAAAGQANQMFQALEGAYRQRDVFFVYLQDVAFFEPYHDDPRYHALLRRMSLARNTEQAYGAAIGRRSSPH